MFQLTKVRTAKGLKLAQKLWDFLTLTVEKKFNTRWQDKQINDWAGVFDVFLMDHDYKRVCAVFDFYAKEWTQKRGYIHLTPESFIGDYPLIEQRYEWGSRPIPESELKQILRPLSLERWECEWSQLVTAVSKSVYAVRSFIKALAIVDIPPAIKKRIRAIFGNVNEYVQGHFLKWRKRQIEAVWVATITQDMIFNEVRKCFTKLGYPDNVRSQSTKLLMTAIKEVDSYAGDGNRSR